jgi:ABC-2 type transport system permease protein
MLHNLFFKTLWDYRYAILGWSIGLIGLSFYLMYFYPYIRKSTAIFEALEHMPPIIKNLIGENIKLGTPAGFFSIQPFSMMAPLLFIIFGITKGGDTIAGEMEKGTLDLLLANPLPRWRLVVDKFAATGVSLLVLAIIFWIGMVSGSLIFNIKISALRLAEAIISCFMLGMVFLSLTLALGCFSLRKKMSYGLVSGFAVIAYLINAYAPMVSKLKPYRIFSPFYYYNGASPLINGLDIVHLLVLVGLCLLFFLLSLYIFDRKNILS